MSRWVLVAAVVLLLTVCGAESDETEDKLPDVTALHRKVTELCVSHCEALLRDTAMCAASGSGFCRFVSHLTAEDHLAEMARETGRVASIGEKWETVLEWAVKDLVTAKHAYKNEDDHAMVGSLMEHVAEVVGAMFAFHEHSENL
jgi:type IV secretory pathway VirJ component